MCTSPITAYHDPEGGRPIFGYKGILEGLNTMLLPCGKCPECKKSYYTDWATRGSRELLKWESSLFITLTYNDENLPKGGSLDKKEIQKFLKRLKKHFNSCKSNPVRQIYCGEYGTKTNRPHYHLIIFNADFPWYDKHRRRDKTLFRTTEQGHNVYHAKTLDALWGRGHAEFGYATPATIAYLFKYILKKKSRKEKEKPLIINGNSVEHEFIEASRNPGIGADMRFSSSIRKGYLSVNGVRKKLPKYYLEYLKKTEPRLYEELQSQKFDFATKKRPLTEAERKYKENAQRLLTDTKKRL